jgi:hypothetical protein
MRLCALVGHVKDGVREIFTKRQSVPSNVDRGANAHETGLQMSCGAAEKEPWHKVALI